MPSSSHFATLTASDSVLDVVWHGPEPKGPGVYEIRLPFAVPRLCGETATLYIGRSRRLEHRLAGFKSGEHSAARRLLEVLRGGSVWPADAPRACALVAMQLDAAESDPELEEVRRIAAFQRAHCELPPLNRSAPGDFGLLALRRIAAGVAERLHDLKGLTKKTLRVGDAWDREDEGIGYVPILFRGVEQVRLAWTWPAASGGSAHRPEWWPATDRLEFKRNAVYLFAARGWDPFGHAAVTPSKAWCAAEDDDADADAWVCHVTPHVLAEGMFAEPTPSMLALLAEGRIADGLKPLQVNATMSEALRSVWKGLGERLADLR
jgi:hypothetical protein